ACHDGSGDDDASVVPDAAQDAAMDATPDTPVPSGSGTCAMPIELVAAGAHPDAMTTVFQGNTTGAADLLHPNQGCARQDASELVFHYQVPSGVQAVKLTTEGSTFDTVIYVRRMCAQTMANDDDVACNNNSYDHPPQSILYLVN